MDKPTQDRIREDFLEWTGGDPPESEQQIFVYVEASLPMDVGVNDAEVTRFLNDWMQAEAAAGT